MYSPAASTPCHTENRVTGLNGRSQQPLVCRTHIFKTYFHLLHYFTCCTSAIAQVKCLVARTMTTRKHFQKQPAGKTTCQKTTQKESETFCEPPRSMLPCWYCNIVDTWNRWYRLRLERCTQTHAPRLHATGTNTKDAQAHATVACLGWVRDTHACMHAHMHTMHIHP